MANDNLQDWTALRLDGRDNLATALRDLKAGAIPQLPGCNSPVLQDAIARGHKFALNDIAEGDHALKYGQAIGIALTGIAAGEHVHLHNIEGLAGRTERKKGA